MKLKVQHATTFTYDEPVYETATEIRLQPISFPLARQRCLDFTLLVEPAASIFHYTDVFGNKVHHFNLLPRHDRLEIKAISVVETGLNEVPEVDFDEVLIRDFLAESRHIIFDPGVREFAGGFEGVRDHFLLAENICREINASFNYEGGHTSVRSTSREVMGLRRGVCQDFAHVMIAVCRCLNLPARYVSGYLYGGVESEDQDLASHAWCEVFVDQTRGWQGFDPTHKTLLVDERYIKIGTGRDYADIPPVRGTYKGRSKEHMGVVVRINRLEEQS